MSTIDEIKEHIAYLKVWLGAFLITLISLVGWLVSNYETAKRFLVALDMIAILCFVVVISLIHKNIQRLIRDLRDL